MGRNRKCVLRGGPEHGEKITIPDDTNSYFTGEGPRGNYHITKEVVNGRFVMVWEREF